MGKHTYENDDIIVTWDSEVCIHSAECINNLGTVFDVKSKPWINVDSESPDKIAIAIKKCPSGALAYQLKKSSKTQTQEQMSDSVIKITLSNKGPYMVKGDVQLVDAAGNRIETRGIFALCRCGASENKPFCDGSHKKIDFAG